MAKVYADLIIKGVKTFENVPTKLQKEVRKILIDKGYIVEGDSK